MAPAAPPASSTPAGTLRRDLLVELARRRPQFLAFLRRRTGSLADAEDLLQHGLLKAAERITDLRVDDRLDAWFYRVLRNTVADARASAMRSNAQLETVAREAGDDVTVDGVSCACSLAVLAGLRPPYAEILRAVDIRGTDLEDAAALLGIARNNAKVRLHRARKAMRAAMLGTCSTNSVRACLSCACDRTSMVIR